MAKFDLRMSGFACPAWIVIRRQLFSFHILSIQKQLSNLTRYIANNQRKSCMKVCLTAGFSMLSLWFYPLTRYVRPCLLIYASLCPNCEKLHCNMLLSEHLLSLEDLVRMGRPNKSVVGLSREEKMMMCIGDIIQVCTQTACARGVHRIYSWYSETPLRLILTDH